MKSKATFAGLGAILLWSTLAAMTTFMSGISPLLLTGLTLILGGSLSLLKIRSLHWPKLFLIVGVFSFFSYHYLLFSALRVAPPMEANLLNYLWPIFIVLLAPVFDRKIKIKLNHIIAIVMGFVGVAFVLGFEINSIDTRHIMGWLMAVTAAIIWSCFSLFLKKHHQESIITTGQICLLSGILALLFSLVSGESVRWSEINWVILLLMGFGPMGVAFYLWFYAIGKGEPQQIAILSYLTPVLSTLWLSIVQSEPVTFRILVALLLIVGGAWVGRKTSKSSNSF